MSHICTICERTHIRWVGYCSFCQNWNSLVTSEKYMAKNTKPMASAKKLSEIKGIEPRRIKSLKGFDLALSGGVVEKSVIVLSGSPGCGKSTLAMQIITQMMLNLNSKGLYVTSEETEMAIARRAARIGLSQSELLVLASSKIEDIKLVIQANQIKLLIIDSIQLMSKRDEANHYGSSKGFNDMLLELLTFIKKHEVTCLLISQLNKQGKFLGAKFLEHIVDVSLSLKVTEERNKVELTTFKNRFGRAPVTIAFEAGSRGFTS